MNPLHYLDFDLKFIRKDADSFLLACRSPAGEAAGAFCLPFAPLETENLILKLSRLKRASRTADSPELAAARKLGGGLFEAIFQGQVRDCFRASLEKVRVQPECGLRLKLRLQDTPELADLPWEYLYDQTFGRFLAQSVQTPLVRYLELPEGIRPLHTAFPLRILGLISGPSDYAALDTAREKELVEQAVAPLISQGLATLEWLPKADLSSLRAALRREHHILHFIGHSGVGELVLEDERGKGRLVSGEVLGVLLHDCRSLRLVVLNSCEGARSGPEDPFAGIAAALVRQGLPAVVAMQFEISDGVAIEFAKEFYDALALGWPVDAAVAEARKAVLCLGSMEWGTPVLHLRAENGMLFELPEKTEKEKFPKFIELEIEQIKSIMNSLHKDMLAVSREIYCKMMEENSVYIDFEKEFYVKNSRVINELEANSFILVEHVLTSSTPRGIEIINPIYILYISTFFEKTEQLSTLIDIIDKCKGEWLNSRKLNEKTGIPEYVINSIFKIYKNKNYGLLSERGNSCSYFGK
ncbi:CHAT domain-containing protein [Candidatus Electronema sp. JC]|uniref:CHAT domain-containing protein n=1 Tax=Candidatus Electronema sp. JC TaxID=3401570 RepID=UPI003B4324A8